MQHSGTTEFETARLICRRFNTEDDKDMLNNWAADPDSYRWAIIEKTSGQNIGQIALCKVYSDCCTAEIEYCIGKSFWGSGYAGEALSGLMRFIFNNTGFQKLKAYHRVENVKSGRVLEKSRMHITDTVQRFVRENKEPVGEVCYCITRDEYLDSLK